jgi:DNA-binding transcriptional LysR family regulator
MKRGELGVHASQTIASNWLPPILMRFHEAYPGISICLTVGNTHSVAQAVLEGSAEIGFVEGRIDEPALNIHRVAQDALVIVVAPDHPFASGHDLTVTDLTAGTAWVMREPGSGTRSEFEDAMGARGASFDDLAVAIVLPSNEAVLSAVASGQCAAAISRIAAAPYLEQGTLKIASFELPVRSFFAVRHKERHQSKASRILEELCVSAGI